jgi:putative NADH-flavin reductase
MRLIVFGASGRTGRHLVAQSLERDDAVTAFVRDPAKLSINHRNLRIVQGDVADAAAVGSALGGQEAVLSALGVGRPLRHDAAVVAGIGHLVREMEKRGIMRLVYLSTLGVRESRRTSGIVLRFIAPMLLRQEFSDHEAKEALVGASRLEWTIVRAPGLTNGQLTGRYRSGTDLTFSGVFPTLSRADVAQLMLNQVIDRSSVRRTLTLLPP